MYDRYNLSLSDQDKKIFDIWNRQYPVTEWEKERNQRNARVMGWGKDYVSKVDLSLCE